ncbi:thermonuclease family protein [Psittacicella gerlachiana]|uniref:TNase-like domain-containing protein n=1 Tax=Psittacicella gerlachiana TaxID=2028574 RepID=A0A3A1YQW3_9GAMM|nr:thermonuclease family protein [Psittacicella gerlachiana]RIY38417.1 hypothetical protein CKF59_00970 [Psittacicella gerlachiana]
MSDYKKTTPPREDNLAQERWRRNRNRKIFLFPLLFLIFAAIVYYFDQQQLKEEKIMATSASAVKQPMLESSLAPQEQEVQGQTLASNTQETPEVKIEEQKFEQIPRIEISGLGKVGYETKYISLVPNINLLQTLPVCSQVQVLSGNSFTCLFGASQQKITVSLLGVYAPALTNAQGKPATYGVKAQEQLQKMIDLDDKNHQVYLQIHQVQNNIYQATAYNILGANLAYTMLYNGYAFVDLKVDIDQIWGQQYGLAAINAQNQRLGMWDQKQWIDDLPPVDPQNNN